MLLIVVLMVLVAGCGGDSLIQYPNAPTISIHKTSWERYGGEYPYGWMILNYRLDGGINP